MSEPIEDARYVDVALGAYLRGRMTVLIFAWAGSGFPPGHQSLN